MVKFLVAVYFGVVLLAGLADRWFVIWRFRRGRDRIKTN
jgi:hypothetical protein